MLQVLVLEPFSSVGYYHYYPGRSKLRIREAECLPSVTQQVALTLVSVTPVAILLVMGRGLSGQAEGSGNGPDVHKGQNGETCPGTAREWNTTQQYKGAYHKVCYTTLQRCCNMWQCRQNPNALC